MSVSLQITAGLNSPYVRLVAIKNPLIHYSQFLLQPNAQIDLTTLREGFYMICTQPDLLFKHVALDQRTQKRTVHICRRASAIANSDSLSIPQATIGVVRYSNTLHCYTYDLNKGVELTTLEYAEIQLELERCKELTRLGRLSHKFKAVDFKDSE